MPKLKKRTPVSFEVRCSRCGFFELWGLEQGIRALTAAGKLSPASDFDAALFAELLLAHAAAIPCPQCRNIGTLSIRKAEPGRWDWEDAVRCEDCDAEIPEARLQAVPEATRCIRCQERFEKGC